MAPLPGSSFLGCAPDATHTCCECSIQVGATGVQPAVQLSASCLENVVRNASTASGVFEPSPLFAAGCNRTRVSEEMTVQLDLVNFQK